MALTLTACPDPEDNSTDTTSPANVTNLTGTAGNAKVTLLWKEPADADFDHIEITFTPTATSVDQPIIINKGTITKEITGLTNETAYAFTVKAVNTSGNKSSGASKAVTPTATADTAPPADVTALTGTAGDAGVTLSWTEPADSDFDHIEIIFTPTATGVDQPIIINKGTITKEITGLANGTVYTFTVKSVDLAGNKSAGASKAVTLAAFELIPLELTNITTASDIKDAIIAKAAGKTNDGSTPAKALSFSVSGLNVTNAGIMQNLLDGLGQTSKYVNLDFSGCTFANNTFPNLSSVSSTGKSNICSVTLPDSVTEIATGAFKDFLGLTSISLPEATTIGSPFPDVTIGNSAFEGCTALTSVSLPYASIGNNAFEGCTALTSVPNAYSIGNSAFSGCTALTSVSLPNVDSIGNGTFSGCTALTSVSLPNVDSIGNGTFSGCTALTSISLPNATSVSGFYDCTALTSVDLPKATTIGNDAFSGCTALTSVSLPYAYSIGNNAFEGCTALTSVSLPYVDSIGNGTFSGCTALTSISLPNATSIGNNAFLFCGLTSVSLPYVDSIDDHTFYGCTALASVDLPNATSIGNGTFYGCGGLTSISLPNATSIGNVTFYDCTALTSVDLPNAYSIGNSAFDGCDNLTSITLGATPPNIGRNLFDNLSDQTITIKVPSGSVSAYEIWKTANAAKFGGTNITINIEAL